MMDRITKRNSPDTSFLPEDYLQQKAERRTIFISLVLCVLVFAGVIAAFFVTNQRWNDFRHYTKQVNIRYQSSAAAIEQLKQVEDQKVTLLEKAELTTALIERVPKSILFAEIINRMPKHMTLLELELKSQRQDKPITVRKRTVESEDKGKSMVSKKSRSSRSGRKSPADEAPHHHRPAFRDPRHARRRRPHALRRRQVRLRAPEVRTLGAVELRFSESTIVNDHEVYKFRLEATVPTNADARQIEVLETPRMDIFVIEDSLEIMGGKQPEKPVADAGKDN
ncbi:MAG: hypothetical protein R3B46_08015 [Phycisphaerales bacterium]